MNRARFFAVALGVVGVGKGQNRTRPIPNRCPYCGVFAYPLRIDSAGRIQPGWTGAILSSGTVKAGLGRCVGCNGAFWQDAEKIF
jgi:hypothetical protein